MWRVLEWKTKFHYPNFIIMKKIYSLTIGLLVGLASAHAQTTEAVTNETQSTNYESITDAWAGAAENDVLVINQNISLSSRLVVSNNIAVKGANPTVVLTSTNGANGNLFNFNQAADKSLSISDLIIDGGNIAKNPIIGLEKNRSTLTLSNVTFRNVKVKAGGIDFINVKNNAGNNSTVNLHNVIFENCSHSDDLEYNCDMTVWKGVNLNISGDIAMTFVVSEGAKINVAGQLTENTAIKIKLNNVTPGTQIITNCTDASKFELIDTELRLVAEGNNLVVKSLPVMVESSDSSADGSYESLQEAITAISASTATEATVTLSSNQTVTSRITLQDGKIYTIVPAEGKDVSIAVGSKDIAFLVQKSSVLNISNINICGTGQSVARNQFEAKERGTINFNNVIVSGLDLPDYTVVRALSGGYFNATDVKAENCTGLTAFAFYGLSGSKLIGESNIDLIIENNNSVNAAEWTPSEPVFVTITGANRPNNSDVLLNYTDLGMVNIVNTDWALYSDGKNIRARNDKAPAPVASVEGNVISLSCEEGFSVWYAVTASNEAPEADAYQPYENGIDVESFGNVVNYVWAIAKGEGYVASDPVFVGVFNNGGSEEGVIYSQVESAEQLGEGYSCIIVAENSNGEYRALGKDMAGVEVKINNGVISAFKSDFKATEFQHNGGVLTENGAAASRAAALSLDGLKVMAGSEQLGYDEASDSFSTDGANKNLMLFTTGSNKNTGVDEVAVDNESAPVEYYNLQGVRVENPANGLYIKRQGSKVEKVIIR